MCLDTVDRGKQEGTGIGYKVFRSDESYHLSFPLYGGRIKYNNWYVDKAKGKIRVPFLRETVSYSKGYHIFLTLQGAKAWGLVQCSEAIRRVDYQDVVASGIQEGQPVVVARKLFIHKKEDND